MGNTNCQSIPQEYKTDVLKGATYYNTRGLPNPRVVDIFAAEIGLLDELYKVEKPIDLLAGGNRTPEMYAMNPDGGLPFIKLADGTVVSETIAICKMLEDAYIVGKKDKLFGNDVVEQALVSMWQRRVDQNICMASFYAFRAGMAKELFKERGIHSFCEPAAAEAHKASAKKSCQNVEELCKGNSSPYIVLDRITIVDVQLFAILHFVLEFDALGSAPDATILDGCEWMKKWYANMASRASNAATVPPPPPAETEKPAETETEKPAETEKA